MTGATLRQALAFATCGWPVLPCLPGQKIPATAHGYRDATTDPGQITGWFGRHPDWNLAVATGAPAPTSSTSTTTARPGAATRRSAGSAPPPCWTARPSTSAPPAAACTPISPAHTSATVICPRTTRTSAHTADTS
jgi:hypothetical protein